MTTTLLLNASYEPLAVLPLKRAVLLVLQEKAEIIHEGEGLYRSAHLSIPIPRVIRLTYYVKVPFQRKLTLSRQGVFRRDQFKCQYCGKKDTSTNLTIDHVHPRAKGGRHVWENVVTCCKLHNRLKADKTLKELGWTLMRKPFAPTGTQWLILGVAKLDETWAPYLGVEVEVEATPALA